MLSANKSRRLATEFFGQWLGFYQFDRFNGVDPVRFPEFDAGLKAALYEEAIAMCQHIIQADLSYDAIIDAETTFVDRRAAEHYGIAWQEDWTAPRQFSVLKSLGG